ncbi:10114_t:CDS:2 [Racocetra persica]|uniref:10114_t:CDS:1 n=1 Tax=Racocetra persica TaxID=160502 RepID=A0ACA9LN09_9GLOM|nr:10114_t:CDS:2 [Racocetra persica]
MGDQQKNPEALQNLQVKHYDYLSFKDIQPIGGGAFSDVSSATFEENKYALKQMKKSQPLNSKIATHGIIDHLSKIDVKLEFITNTNVENETPVINVDGQSILTTPSYIPSITTSSINLSGSLLDKLWSSVFLSLTNLGNEFRQIRKAIIESIEEQEKSQEDVFNDLKNRTNHSNSHWISLATIFNKGKENNDIQSGDGNN